MIFEGDLSVWKMENQGMVWGEWSFGWVCGFYPIRHKNKRNCGIKDAQRKMQLTLKS